MNPNPYMQSQINPYMNRYQNQIPSNNIVWVQGVEGAKGYQLMPSSNVRLLDSENDGIFYIKSSDNVGMCNMRVFKYEEVQSTPNTPAPNMSEYVRKDELEAMLTMMLGGKTDEQSVSGNDEKSERKSSKQITK